MPDNPFTRHPTEVGESYGRHFVAASGFGLKMIGGGLACLVHAIFPFWFERTGSRTTDELHRRLSRRTAKADYERHPII
ncbi:MAG: hypothetical protein QOI38_1844 [Sphingomonadales bacterium]|jgi:hypothetical protein|nr:hypothetical protein [Sphingomonadales bacterium]